MCTVLLQPGDNPIAVNKYIISIHDTYRPVKKIHKQNDCKIR